MKSYKTFRCLNFGKRSLILVLFILTSCKKNIYNTVCDYDFNIGNGLSINPLSKQIFISKPTGKKDKKDKNQYSLYELSFSKKNYYSTELITVNSKYSDYHPVFSVKGDFLLFNSTRPKPNDSTSNGKVDIYMSQYKDGKLSKPKYLEKINTEYHDSYPTLTKINKLYFNSDRPGGKGMMDIYVSEYKNGNWQTPNLVPELNSEHSENDLVVDPDERFIILNRYITDSKEIDLFISYNENGKWSEPKPMDSINKPNVWELTPTLSLDGKTLFLEVNGKVECYEIEYN